MNTFLPAPAALALGILGYLCTPASIPGMATGITGGFQSAEGRGMSG